MKKLKELNLEFPRIGMRIIKSAIAVLLCFIVDYYRNGAGIVFKQLILPKASGYDYVGSVIISGMIVLVNIWGF